MNIPNNTKIILGSGSPRRQELLAKIFTTFDVIIPNCKEFFKETIPEIIVQDLADQKGGNVKEHVLANFSGKHDYLIITSDTLVEINGQILGKPQTKDEAFQMLSLLQNDWHHVWTGVCLHYINNKIVTKNVFADKANVHMISLNEDDINNYIKTGSPMDKAGAYGIQDFNGKLIDKFEGDHDTIMGLPTIRLNEVLHKMFLDT